jgi:predicted nucleic acid-binding protein
MSIAVNDANIFIDLLEVDLIDTFFKLKLDLHTTNLVLNELDAEQQAVFKKYINRKLLTVKILNETEMLEIKKLELASGKLSAQDVSVYAYAKEINAMILTSDRRLRNEAQGKGFEVHGILWLFEQLLEEELIKPKKAIDKLTELMQINTWLPKDECKKRIEQWTKKI